MGEYMAYEIRVPSVIASEIEKEQKQAIQTTLAGIKVAPFPKVRNSDGFMVEWDRNVIVSQLLKETKLSEIFYNKPAITKEEAEVIALDVERLIKQMNIKFLSGPLIREMVNNVLLERGHIEWRNIMTRVGASVYDAYEIDAGSGFEANDNANQLNNAETSHKRKADKMSKEQNLLLMPRKLADLHLNGDIHIHDLEYFGTRPFCQDHDLRYFFYYGLMPDGIGTQCSVAKPAKNAEVAILHAVKAMGSAQTNFAGGQGLYNFLTFFAPYFEHKSENEIAQLMQMFIYEMMQMMTARGGQSVFSSVQLSPGVSKLWKNIPIVYAGKVWDGKQAPLRTYGEFEREVRLGFKAMMDVMLEGDAWGKPFSFPKPEISIEPEFMEEDEEFNAAHPELPTRSQLYRKSFELAAKFGTPYFDNQLPSYRNAGDGISCYQCIPAHTKIVVKTEHGLKLIPISEVNKGDEILTPTGISGFEDMLCRAFDGDLNTVTLEGNRVVLMTDDHELTVVRNDTHIKIKAAELLKTDKVKVCTKLPSNNVELFRAMDKFGIDHAYVEEFCYFIGAYCAEGNVLIRNSRTGGHRMQISLGANEEDFANDLIDTLKNVFGIVPSVKEIRGNEIRILVYSKSFCEKFRDLHIPEKTSDGWIPDFIFTASPKAKWNFLHGYYYGDGTYGMIRDKYPNITIYTKSKDTVQGLCLLLQSIGIVPTSSQNNRGSYEVRIAIGEHVRRFFDGPKVPIESYTLVNVRSIEKEHYTGDVYDPINVGGHEFVTASGIVIGNCCAYQFSSTPEQDAQFNDKLMFKEGAHFSMGSWMVLSLNCPRAAYKAECDDEKLFTELKVLMANAVEIFRIKRKWMDKLIERGRIPFASQRPKDPSTGEAGAMAVDFEALVYTIGLIGINEMVQYHTGYQIHESPIAYKLAIRTILELKQYARELEKENGITIALARTPAETTAQRFAVSDLLHSEYVEQAKSTVKGDLTAAMKGIHKTRDLPIYYTNGTHVTPGADISLPERIKLEQTFFPIVDGGNIMHIWLGESNPDPEGLQELAMYIAKNTQTGYFAFTRDMTICTHEGYVTSGLLEKCPRCGSNEVQHLSRITGYLQSVDGWNKGKRQELLDRKRYDIR
jgi:anaerobic ribonucleoside-triphosphate reductase/intein/homing endonuclease